MDAMQISKDGLASRILDIVAILIVGATIGVACSLAFSREQVEIVRPTNVLRQPPTTKDAPREGTVDAPMYPNGVEVEEG